MKRLAIPALLLLSLAAAARADSGRPVGNRTYTSANGAYTLTVEPRWSEDLRLTSPLLTLRSRSGKTLWVRKPDDFEDFRFPLHVCVSNDGEHLVFGGYSVHNYGKYEEGLRFYDGAGRLLAFISRRDLPRGQRSISTAAWYDDGRTHIDGDRLVFFTPGVAEPMLFDVHSGDVLAGEVIEGQGDDRGWFEELREQQR